MRERIKRRKKPNEAAAEATQAPLQPAYFDAGVPTPEPAAVEARVAPEESSEVEAAEPATAEAPVAAGESGETGDGRQRRRRRRGRGGRGRGRGGSQPAAVAEGTAAVPEEFAAHVPAAKPLPVAVAVPVAVRQPKGTVVLSIGLPGSGKSSWFKRHNITPLSSDLLRAILFDDATEQRFQDLVFSNLRSLLKARLIARRPLNYVDATNLTPHERHSWIKLAKDSGYEVQAVFFDVPLEVCMQRNQRRSRVVAEDVMRRMAGKLKAPTFDEGFSKITVVKVKQKD